MGQYGSEHKLTTNRNQNASDTKISPLAYSFCIDMQVFAYELLETHDVFIKQTSEDLVYSGCKKSGQHETID